MWMAYDLLSGLIPLALYLAVLGILVGIAVLWARRRRSSTLALSVTRSLAGTFLGLVVFGAVLGGINTFAVSHLALSGHLREWVTSNRASILSPTCNSDGAFSVVLDPADGPGPVAYCQGAIENIPLMPRFVLFAGALLVLLAAAAIAWSIYTAALLASMRDPFHPSVPRTFRLASIVVVVGAVVGDLLRTIGMTLAARSLDWGPDLAVPFFFEFPLWPFAVALGLFALSAIFRYGAQLQRETEGLV